MALYVYTGEPDRIWPDVPTTPDPGDVVEWRDIVPDANSWEPVKTAKNVRPADNASDEDSTPVAEPAPAPPVPPEHAATPDPTSATSAAAPQE